MKKIRFTGWLLILFFITHTSKAQQAPNVTAFDCNGNYHDFYSELDSGKVLVLCWVMPCPACEYASTWTYNIVQSYLNPDVVFYLIDDQGNTSCGDLLLWATGINIGSDAVLFSSDDIKELLFGAPGMPHIVVIGPSNYTIYFNKGDTATNDTTALRNAIDLALASAGIEEEKINPLRLWASVTDNVLKINYSIKQPDFAYINILDESGKIIWKKEPGKLSAGDYNNNISIEQWAAGNYFIRFQTNGQNETLKFSIFR